MLMVIILIFKGLSYYTAINESGFMYNAETIYKEKENTKAFVFSL